MIIIMYMMILIDGYYYVYMIMIKMNMIINMRKQMKMRMSLQITMCPKVDLDNLIQLIRRFNDMLTIIMKITKNNSLFSETPGVFEKRFRWHMRGSTGVYCLF